MIKSNKLRGARKVKGLYCVGNLCGVVENLERKRKCCEKYPWLGET